MATKSKHQKEDARESQITPRLQDKSLKLMLQVRGTSICNQFKLHFIEEAFEKNINQVIVLHELFQSE